MTHAIRIEYTNGKVWVKEGLSAAEAEDEYRVPDDTGMVFSATVLKDGKPAYGWVRKGRAS